MRSDITYLDGKVVDRTAFSVQTRIACALEQGDPGTQQRNLLFLLLELASLLFDLFVGNTLDDMIMISVTFKWACMMVETYKVGQSISILLGGYGIKRLGHRVVQGYNCRSKCS